MNFAIYTQAQFSLSIRSDWNDNGFLNPEFLEKKMKYCSGETVYCGGWGKDDRHFFVAYTGDRVVGLLKIKIGGPDSCFNPGWCNWIDYVTVDPEYKKNGIATALLGMMFKSLVERGEKHMLASSYSTEGFNYLRLKIRELAVEHGIEYKDKDEIGFI